MLVCSRQKAEVLTSSEVDSLLFTLFEVVEDDLFGAVEAHLFEVEPPKEGLLAEPGELPFGVVARGLLDLGYAVGKIVGGLSAM